MALTFDQRLTRALQLGERITFQWCETSKRAQIVGGDGTLYAGGSAEDALDGYLRNSGDERVRVATHALEVAKRDRAKAMDEMNRAQELRGI